MEEKAFYAVMDTQSRVSGSSIKTYNSVEECPTKLIIDGVCIEPPVMFFKDAYDGKHFQQSLMLINTGQKQAVVRVGQPTSMKFKMKPIMKILPTGLSITRKISFTFCSATSLPQACVGIYINDTFVNYRLLVLLCFAHVAVQPKVLDFGYIDIGISSGIRTIDLSNKGTKHAVFSVDLGQNELELVVEPMKGSIKPKSSLVIKLELFAMRPGAFNSEFWIKTEPPLRVKLMGEFIKPQLIFQHPFKDNFVTLLFPKIYVGTSYSRILTIKNFSSVPCMFFILAEKNESLLKINEARSKYSSFRQFNIRPIEGRLLNESEVTIRVTFCPSNKLKKSYYICMYRIMKVAFRDFPRSMGKEYFCKCSPRYEIEAEEIDLSEDLTPSDEIELSRTNYLELFLYAEVEKPCIKLRPDNISFRDLPINEVHSFEVFVENTSQDLPIFVEIAKVACIEFEPAKFGLKKTESLEILLKIKPSKLGEVVNKIQFTLFDPRGKLMKVSVQILEVTYNGCQKVKKAKQPKFSMGLTPLYTNEVGFLTDDIRFNSKVKMPRQAIVDRTWKNFDKNNSALVAFPNDRPKSVRPWKRSTPCNTIFANIPRNIATHQSMYELSSVQQTRKEELSKYYMNYIKNWGNKYFFEDTKLGTTADYETCKALLMMENEKFLLKCVQEQPKHFFTRYFIPLGPEHLYNISIKPKFVYLGRLALQTTAKGNFVVENNNSFDIMVMMQALSSSIVPSASHTKVPPNSSKNVYFSYNSETGGKQHVPIMILVNFTHVFDVTVLARIVPKTTYCLNDELLIDPKDNFGIIEIANPMQNSITFMVDPCYYELKPKSGYGRIPPKRKICNSITYIPKVDNEAGAKEVYISSESGVKHLIKIIYDSKKPQVILSSYSLNFEDVPLNIPVSKELTIRNMSNEHVIFTVYDSSILKEIELSITESIIPPKSDLNITVTVHLNEMVRFKCPINIKLQETPKVLEIVGSAIFPIIQFIPDIIKLPKVVAGSLTTTKIKIRNNCASEVNITFPLGDYPEFEVKSEQGSKISTLVLKTKETQEIYWDFFPTEAMAYCILFPYVLNGILGPPELNDPSTLQCSTYLTVSESPQKTKVDTPAKMNTLKILCSACPEWLKFNTLNMKFLYYNGQEKTFEVTNISEEEQTVYMDIIGVKHFSVAPEEELEFQLGYYKADIEPQSSIRFTIEFTPEAHGVFYMKIPIMVEKFHDGTAVYNNLALEGIYPAPYIIASPRVLYFPPLLKNRRYSLNIEVHLLTHEKMQCDEKVHVEVFDKSIVVNLEEKEKVSDYDREVAITLEFHPKEDEIFLDSKIIISCSCYSACEIFLKGVVSKSILRCLSMSKSPTNKCEEYLPPSTYPFFPDNSDDSCYAKHLRGIVKALEKWIYEQGFFYKNFYRIPETISRYTEEITESKKDAKAKPKKSIGQLPLLQLLANLVNKSILDYINCGLSPASDENHQTLFLYATYKNALAFLKSQKAFDPKIRPEHLLPYKEYSIYKSKIEREEESRESIEFDYPQFYAFSKRCWVDLLLNIYKVFVVDRTVHRYIKQKTKDTTPQENDDLYYEEFQKYVNAHSRSTKIYDDNENKLLLWLEFHYNKQRLRLWSDESAQKTIQAFEDIADSLALATVTVAYCPYVKETLQDMYPIPINKEQLVHNACRLVQTWQQLGISFNIHPSSIRKANRVMHLMIVSYLYAVLPSYYPKMTVELKSPPAESIRTKISIRNNEDCAIGYVTKLYGEKDMFEVEDSFTVAPKKQKDVVVSYLAKTIQKCEAVLLINGEAPGQKYGRSMVVNLHGLCDISSCTEYKIGCTVFKQTIKKIKIESPYAVQYTAKVIVTILDSPENKDNFLSMTYIKKNNIPRQITTSEEMEFDEDGNGILTVQTCFLCLGDFSYLLCLSNDVVGDFCTRIIVRVKPNKNNIEDITVVLCDNYQRKKCTCKSEVKVSCPRTFNVPIPSINSTLLGNLATLIDIWVREDKVKYWNEIMEKPLLAFRFLKHYIGKFPKHMIQFSEIFADSATYRSQGNKKKNFSIPEMVKIPNTSSQSAVMLPMHWNAPEYPAEELLVLENENGKEIRYYKLIFNPPPQAEVSNYEIVGEGDE